MYICLYNENGARRPLVALALVVSLTAGVTVACSSNHAASVACAGTAETAFTLSTSDHGSTSGTSGSSNKSSTSSTSGSTGSSGSTTTSGGASGSSTSSGGSTSGGTSSTSGGTGRYGSNGGTSSGGSSGTTTTSGGTGSNGSTGSISGGSTLDKNAKTGLSGTVKMPNSIPAPPKGTTRVTVPGEKAYMPPSNRVKQPPNDIKAAQASVQNRRFLMKSGSHYKSPVTKHVYYYHAWSYYTASVYQDLYNPYDPRNYHDSGYGTLIGELSPYWPLFWATMVVGSCWGPYGRTTFSSTPPGVSTM